MTATVPLPTAAAGGSAAELRAVGRVVELASGLLLDEHHITGRLPMDARAQASRLRHAVKLAIQTVAARSVDSPLRPAVPKRPDPARELCAWIAAQSWAQQDPGPTGWAYLLCFRDPTTGQHQPYRGNGPGGQFAGHYYWKTSDLVRRISREHANPHWSGPGRLVKVALAVGLTFKLAYVEYPATRERERRLKRQGSAYRRCPLCRGTGTPLDPVAVVAAVRQAGGAR